MNSVSCSGVFTLLFIVKKIVYRFIPINGPLFRQPFPARVNFRPSKGPFILGLISSIRLLTTRYWPFLLVGQIQPVVTIGPFAAP